MFALLEHVVSAASGKPDRHWDLLIELPGAERLPTWRLAANPAEETGPVAAVRIADHRREYLDYEGPISGDRGAVTRVDRGPCEVLVWFEDLATFELAGAKLRGRFVLYGDSGEDMVFERAT